MNPNTQSVILETFNGSHEGRLHFGQVIGLLSQAGVESYLVDYRAGRATYYTPTGETHTIDMAVPEVAIAQTFDAGAVVEAIRGAQRGEVMYPEFKQLSQRAGCIGYVVWITGRHVSYFGRNGETHVERFPD